MSRAEGDLSRSKKGKADKCRIDVYLELLKTGEETVVREVGAGQDQGRELGNRGIIKMKTVQEVETNRKEEANQEEAVLEKRA